MILYLMKAGPTEGILIEREHAEPAVNDLITQVMKLLTRRKGEWVWSTLGVAAARSMPARE